MRLIGEFGGPGGDFGGAGGFVADENGVAELLDGSGGAVVVEE